MKTLLKAGLAGGLMAMLVVASVGATASGTITVTTSPEPPNVRAYRMAWTSAADGTVSAVPVVVQGGKLLSVTIVPNTSTTQPTDLYDLTLLTEDGIDLLSSRGTDLSNASGSILVFDPPLHVPPSLLYPTVTHAGNAKTGTLVLRVE